jgi:hypothetical protein
MSNVYGVMQWNFLFFAYDKLFQMYCSLKTTRNQKDTTLSCFDSLEQQSRYLLRYLYIYYVRLYLYALAKLSDYYYYYRMDGTFCIGDANETFSVEKLIYLTQDIESVEIPVADLVYLLHVKCWDDTWSDEVSPMDVLRRPKSSFVAEHYERILRAELEHPILIGIKQTTKQYQMYDGAHRLAKAWKDKRRSILTKIVPDEILYQAKM